MRRKGDCGAGGRAGNAAGIRLGFGFAAGWGKWLYLVLVGRKNGFVWYFLSWRAGRQRRRARAGGGRLDVRERHVGFIVARGKGVVGGKVFVFNEKQGNVRVTDKGFIRFAARRQFVSKNWGLRLLSRVSSGCPVPGVPGFREINCAAKPLFGD
jgi:hypothetical protein